MNKVEITGVNTSRLKTLPESEKTRLLLLARQGDPAAREQLVSGNLRLVLSVVQKFAGRSENPDDLFQVGCIGLIKAIDHFDPAFDVRFSTYAVPMIVGEIRRYLRDNNAVRVSLSLIHISCVQDKDVIITIVGYPKDVEEVYFGENGIIANAKPGAVLIDMTTTSPKLSERIYAEAKPRGISALDAPVSGGDSGAKAGTLSIMVGGDREAFDACQDVFAAMGTNIIYEGGAGKGQHLSLIHI